MEPPWSHHGATMEPPWSKILPCCTKALWVVKWCLWTPGVLIGLFWGCFGDLRFSEIFCDKKFFWNTDLNRSVFPFFQRAKSPPKLYYIVLKKIWGYSPYGLVFLGTKNGYPYRMNFGEKWPQKVTKFSKIFGNQKSKFSKKLQIYM